MRTEERDDLHFYYTQAAAQVENAQWLLGVAAWNIEEVERVGESREYVDRARDGLRALLLHLYRKARETGED